MKHICIGILAHVDSGKTTLSEGLLYASGALRKLGRVDHGNAFLDTDALERERGITIFAKQAMLTVGEREFTLLDTPGHVDFSAEMERTLSVLDYAVLVISGSDGVQSHTRTLWRLLTRYEVPTFLFINKMDLAGTDKSALMERLTQTLSAECVDFSAPPQERDEALALCDEAALESLLERGSIDDSLISEMIKSRKVFPCFFGSALKMGGVEDFLSALARFTVAPEYPSEFGAKVFKISRDAQGGRLTWLKVTGGALRVKAPLSYRAQNQDYQEKADQLRLYSGIKFRTLEKAGAGSVVAVTGLSHSYVGLGLGTEAEASAPLLQPVLTYQLVLPDGADAHSALTKLRELEEEDPMLRIVWDERYGQIHVQLMGKIQLEILRRRILDRFGLAVTFGEGSIVYRETIASPVLGMGHFEPLRHYAEVQLLIEPLPRGTGIQLASNLATDALDLNWQRLIFTHLLEREHAGVLTGSALTDVRFTLVAGRAHLKHTEGGDFRQATYRAVRQGLMQAESLLLEPYYDFRLEVPAECVGRAMTDLQNMGGTVDSPQSVGENTVLTGYAPVRTLRDYFTDVAAYTRGRGQLSCAVRGYETCQNQDEIVALLGYDAERDTDNPASSVFCDHGGSITIPWNEVAQHVHCDSGIHFDKEETEEKSAPPPRRGVGAGSAYAADKELQEIFERTYGKVARRAFEPAKKPARTSLADHYDVTIHSEDTEYLLVDGYNIIFAWDELQRLAAQDIAAARGALIDILANYQGFRKCRVIVVFDAYKVKGNPGSVQTVHGIKVVYTKEAETADTYIERATYELRRERRVRVATSDGPEQVIILGHGALRVSARAFHAEVEAAEGQISAVLQSLTNRPRSERTVRNNATIKQ
ncbi:MAG: translation factor GTPase family protein [Oscillospiraceae bacterium]|nr:TetM/TetW/TetO/TetS family tetracycline resistance ribosomal protection protein [Oscillibacter sp.]MDY5016975.1 translation factor GTPase family protein [Oscillospiraceae bacterium]